LVGGRGDLLQSAVRLVDGWCSRRPDVLLDPPYVWDDVVTNRFVNSDTVNIYHWTANGLVYL